MLILSISDCIFSGFYCYMRFEKDIPDRFGWKDNIFFLLGYYANLIETLIIPSIYSFFLSIFLFTSLLYLLNLTIYTFFFGIYTIFDEIFCNLFSKKLKLEWKYNLGHRNRINNNMDRECSLQQSLDFYV